MDLLDRIIYATDSYEKKEILEQTLKKVHTEYLPDRIVRFNGKKHNTTQGITTGILNSITYRNKRYQVFKQTKTDVISYATIKYFSTDIEIFEIMQLPL